MADLLPPLTTEQADKKVDNSKLTCPVGYDEVNREAFKTLNPGYFSGFYLNYCPSLYEDKFFIGSTIVPGAYSGLGAYYFNTRLTLIGRVTTDGTLTTKVKAAITDKWIVKAQTALIDESRLFDTLVSFEYMALNYKAQFLLGSKGLTAATYIQRVSPCLSLGGELFWASVPQKSGIGYVARYETDKMVASAQVISSGNVFMSYVQKISKKVSLASDFVYNCFSRDVKASVGCDCDISRFWSRVQGKIDSNGVAYASLEKQLKMGLACVLSASLDHKNKDYRLGLGLAYGSPPLSSDDLRR
ncbi:unnamed protein product [Arabidopsis halleri]